MAGAFVVGSRGFYMHFHGPQSCSKSYTENYSHKLDRTQISGNLDIHLNLT